VAFKFCPECGAEMPAAAHFREQRKTVTVLFCDLTGSTVLGEALILSGCVCSSRAISSG
jgi:hypothetical protein